MNLGSGTVDEKFDRFLDSLEDIQKYLLSVNQTSRAKVIEDVMVAILWITTDHG